MTLFCKNLLVLCFLHSQPLYFFVSCLQSLLGKPVEKAWYVASLKHTCIEFMVMKGYCEQEIVSCDFVILERQVGKFIRNSRTLFISLIAACYPFWRIILQVESMIGRLLDLSIVLTELLLNEFRLRQVSILGRPEWNQTVQRLDWNQTVQKQFRRTTMQLHQNSILRYYRCSIISEAVLTEELL
jgi:hypothetical protein